MHTRSRRVLYPPTSRHARSGLQDFGPSQHIPPSPPLPPHDPTRRSPTTRCCSLRITRPFLRAPSPRIQLDPSAGPDRPGPRRNAQPSTRCFKAWLRTVSRARLSSELCGAELRAGPLVGGPGRGLVVHGLHHYQPHGSSRQGRPGRGGGLDGERGGRGGGWDGVVSGVLGSLVGGFV